MFTNWLTSPSTSSSSMGTLPPTVIATPPDIILEVGPSPSARFVAHSIVLAMHSGYLRSAIRLDENGVPNSDLPIFLTNVTPEQFSPLLTYMYTGYLDLNIENIFGVLLATHVLHMPRALEICRNFLSRMQSEGYLSGAFLTHLNDINNDSLLSSKYSSSSSNSVKVIRPIASKPTISNLGFIVPPMPHVSLPSTGTPFRSLNNQNKSPTSRSPSEFHENTNTSSPTLQTQVHHSFSLKTSITNKDSTTKRSPKLKRTDKSKRDETHQNHMQQSQQQLLSTSTSASSSSSSNNVRKESPSDNENNKVIIDVASCDGPVRFRRVLNNAYGKQPQTIDIFHAHSQERSHQSVSHSFHQQMAKNISQQRQQHSEESENSQDSSSKHQNAINNSHYQTNNSGSSTGEIYNCVYCKHTFKSQYCYQKHAKRHLNPLSLETSNDNNCNSTIISATINQSSSSSNSSSSMDNKNINNMTTTTNIMTTDNGNNTNFKNDKNLNRSLDLKREVRPLDMNVQYYPCKTCGSKFPSYYFVHKHRKMCHPNEGNQNQ